MWHLWSRRFYSWYFPLFLHAHIFGFQCLVRDWAIWLLADPLLLLHNLFTGAFLWSSFAFTVMSFPDIESLSSSSYFWSRICFIKLSPSSWAIKWPALQPSSLGWKSVLFLYLKDCRKWAFEVWVLLRSLTSLHVQLEDTRIRALVDHKHCEYDLTWTLKVFAKFWEKSSFLCEVFDVSWLISVPFNGANFFQRSQWELSSEMAKCCSQ